MFIKVSNRKTAEEFNTKTKKGYWIILYYADWCPHCQIMKPEWNNFSEKMKNNKSINVAEVEHTYLDDVEQKHRENIKGFPTIISCKDGQKVSDFDGPKTSDEILSFANNTPVNKSNQINNLLRKVITKSLKTKKANKKSSKKSTKKSKKTSKKSKKSSRK
jgi:thiol-disulfide isomerase/thioredoxin